MADKQTKTTSSRVISGANDLKATPPVPKSGEAQILKKLADNLTESYQLVKQRQQKYMELTASSGRNAPGTQRLEGDGGWQDVCAAKNKLKRKKKLSASLTSVTDSVNQEKRTRIEGIQLNCRGKLQINENVTITQNRIRTTPSVEHNSKKPPLPPLASKTATTQAGEMVGSGGKTPPPRLKRKLQENVQTIQKLNALTEQLRLEINELKSSLTTERGAVRVLRAQNESEIRKWKNEVKKLQATLEAVKKSNSLYPISSRRVTPEPTQMSFDCLGASASGSLASYEIQRLTNEINAMKDASKALEDKRTIDCDADRRKAADVRTLRDSYEIRLTQLTKSAKTEISRLLEELKTKERNIGQLKKELQVLHAKPQNETKSRNATTNPTTNTKMTNKPKKIINQNKKVNKTSKNKQNNELSGPNTKSNSNKPGNEEQEKDSSAAHDSIEMQKLKEIELINNTKNIQNNVNATKLLSSTQNNKLKTFASTNEHHKTILNVENVNNLLKTTSCGHQKEYYSLPHEIMGRFNQSGSRVEIETTKLPDSHSQFRSKDNNSDSDSALSSAPPSISPQPPPAGMDTTDIWQTIRTYTTDIEKLQKDIEILQHENEQLHSELHLAKEQILESEKTATEATKSKNIQQLMERIRYLEEQEYQLQAETSELREQNELLEFRILELEETTDKWSLQSHGTPSSASTTTSQATMPTTKDVWGTTTEKQNKEDPMRLLFGGSANVDSGITSPHSHGHSEEDYNLMDSSNEDLRRRLGNLLKKSTLDEEDKQCLQQIITLVQQLDLFSQRSGPNSLNTTSSSDEASSLDLIKSRISDYSSASSSSSARSTNDHAHSSKTPKSLAPQHNPRIVATVTPYNSFPAQTNNHSVPHNSPNESPRKARASWQTSSLSESGVFVESDFLSDASENNACTQTDFEDELGASLPTKEFSGELQRLQSCESKCPTVHSHKTLAQLSPNLNEEKRLQYYKDRLELLESKVLIYESSGDLQAKRLADRLQREIQLEKQLKELQDRVYFLQQENSTLEEEKCEFEEAENDTRLRLQRLEVDLEILSQRNVELDVSREALSAKYKDCRAECLILRDDIAVSETQLRHLEEDKQKAKENLELLQKTIPLLLLYHRYLAIPQGTDGNLRALAPVADMGPSMSAEEKGQYCGTPQQNSSCSCEVQQPTTSKRADESLLCQQRDLNYLREEVKCLRHQIRELNSRHYEAMESADSHWVDLEREYKEREVACHAKEEWLKQKICKLEQCLSDDARAANEKIQQLEDAENDLKVCLLRVTKEHRELVDQHENACAEIERLREENQCLKAQLKPTGEEKKQIKSLTDELNFMRKLQQETESQNLAETEALRMQLHDLKKVFLHVEVTNSELKEEVVTLEAQIKRLEGCEKECVDKIRVLTDEVRTKEEQCLKLEGRLQRSEGFSLAQELDGSPSKRFKRDQITDLRSATKAMGSALTNLKDCDLELPGQQKFKNVAHDVKKLAEHLLAEGSLNDEVSKTSPSKPSASRNSLNPESTSKRETEPSKSSANGTSLNPEFTSKRASELSYPEDKNAEGTVPDIETTIQHETEPSAPENTNAELMVPDIEASEPLVATESPTAEATEEAEGGEMEVTVGMALLPPFTIDENLLKITTCSCGLRKPIYDLSQFMSEHFLTVPDPANNIKKAIFEVPSELRKLSLVPAKENTIRTPPPSTETKNNNKNRSKNRVFKSNRCKKSLKARVRRIVSALNERRTPEFHDASDTNFFQSEILQRSISYDSFKSLHDDAPVTSIGKVDASTETCADMFDLPKMADEQHSKEENLQEIEQCDIQEDTFLDRAKRNEEEKNGGKIEVELEQDHLASVEVKEPRAPVLIQESAVPIVVQESTETIVVQETKDPVEEISLGDRMEALPVHTRSFLNVLLRTMNHCPSEVHKFNIQILKHWETSNSFREGLQLLEMFSAFDVTDGAESVPTESYEQFVNAMNALQVLQDLFKPNKISLLTEVEKNLDEQIVKFHRRRMEKEFFCTVYYPVPRIAKLPKNFQLNAK